jgi:hypothetical protein
MNNEQSSPPAARLTDRDHNILAALYDLGGVLSFRQIQTQFFPDSKSEGTCENRLRQLRNSGYIRYAAAEDKRHHAMPQDEKNVCWLGVRGIGMIAASYGFEVEPERIKSEANEKQLQSKLRKAGVHWRRLPWKNLAHDIQVADVYFMVRAAAKKEGLNWLGWMPEWVFRAEPGLQTVTYTTEEQRRDGSTVKMERTAEVYPDGYFVVTRPTSQPDKIEAVAFLVEVDRGSERGARFEKEKIIQGQAYLSSDVYTERTGLKAGRWIFVTTGKTRRDNLKRRAEAVSRRRSHYFSSFDDLTIDGFFSDPVWYLMGREEPLPLLHPPK